MKKVQENHRKVVAALEGSHTDSITVLEKSHAVALLQVVDGYKTSYSYEKDQET